MTKIFVILLSGENIIVANTFCLQAIREDGFSVNYKLVVDSGCDLAPKLLEEPLKAETVPLTMTVDDRAYVDDDNLDLTGFIDDMNSYKGKVMSACPSPQSFNEAFEEGKTNFVVTLSSQLSGSYSSAKMAQTLAEEDGKDVYVFDSKSASAGEMLVSLKIKELVEKAFTKKRLLKRSRISSTKCTPSSFWKTSTI